MVPARFTSTLSFSILRALYTRAIIASFGSAGSLDGRVRFEVSLKNRAPSVRRNGGSPLQTGFHFWLGLLLMPISGRYRRCTMDCDETAGKKGGEERGEKEGKRWGKRGKRTDASLAVKSANWLASGTPRPPYLPKRLHSRRSIITAFLGHRVYKSRDVAID